MQRPGGDDLPCVFSGTLVVHGQGVAVMKETGAVSEIGRIGKALQARGAGADAAAEGDRVASSAQSSWARLSCAQRWSSSTASPAGTG